MSDWISGSVEWLGFLAGFLTSAAWIPELIHLVKTRDAKGISIVMTCMMFVGVACWGMYGALIGSDALVVVNLTTALLVLMVLVLKLYLDRKAAPPQKSRKSPGGTKKGR